MHVDVKIPGLEILVLLVGELRSGGHRPVIAALGQRNDDRAVLSGSAIVNVRCSPIHSRGGDFAADRFIRADGNRAVARRLGLYGGEPRCRRIG